MLDSVARVRGSARGWTTAGNQVRRPVLMPRDMAALLGWIAQERPPLSEGPSIRKSSGDALDRALERGWLTVTCDGPLSYEGFLPEPTPRSRFMLTEAGRLQLASDRLIEARLRSGAFGKLARRLVLLGIAVAAFTVIGLIHEL